MTKVESLALRFVCDHELVRRGYTVFTKDIDKIENELKQLLEHKALTQSSPLKINLSEQVLCDVYFNDAGNLLAGEIYTNARLNDNRMYLQKELRL